MAALGRLFYHGSEDEEHREMDRRRTRASILRASSGQNIPAVTAARIFGGNEMPGPSPARPWTRGKLCRRRNFRFDVTDRV